MIRIDAECASELAILLEIWENGGVVHSSFPVAAGSPIAIAIDKTQVAAEVTRCEPDSDYGYLLDIDVNAPSKWFPLAYTPAWHGSELQTMAKSGDFVC
jgi:hypothetical protein